MIRFFSAVFLVLVVVCSSAAQPYRVDTVARAPYAQYPVTLAFVPGFSGNFLFTEKSTGRVRIFDRALLPEPFLTVSVDDDGEQGLLGIAVDPSYPDTPFVYIFYTRSIDRSNVVERYRDSSGIGIDPRLLLIIPRQDEGTSNNGGSLHFGPDNMLYVSVGDYGSHPESAQDISSRRNQRGKILRINRDGTLPADNPFPGKPFWSYGHRNTLGFTFDDATGAMYCTESASRYANEIYAVPRGGNLGWPTERRAGRGRGDRQIWPLYSFTDAVQPGLTGIVCYRGEAFPRLRGKLVFGGNANPTVWVGSFSARGDSIYPEQFFKSNAGYADIEVSPDGSIYLVNGPYISSRILRLSPVAPLFLSAPPLHAKQDTLYTYTPAFSGTPPALSIVSGPEEMTVDTVTWAVRWTPTNDEALAGTQTVTLRAVNGAGSVDQTYLIQVVNVNDPPAAFNLTIPPDNATFNFMGSDPLVTFEWTPSLDPDRDTVTYILQIDTVATFTSPARRDSVVGLEDSVQLFLPRRSSDYYWRVIAWDGKLQTTSTPGVRTLNVAYFVPFPVRQEKEKTYESVLEQNYPNPFNPATSIKYTIPRAGHVRLVVYNLLGQEIATIFDGVQSEGTHEVEFYKAMLPSGIYFYQIHAPGFFETKKMIIAK